MPLVSEINFFKEKALKEKDLIFLCQRLKFERHESGDEVITYGKQLEALTLRRRPR